MRIPFCARRPRVASQGPARPGARWRGPVSSAVSSAASSAAGAGPPPPGSAKASSALPCLIPMRLLANARNCTAPLIAAQGARFYPCLQPASLCYSVHMPAHACIKQKRHSSPRQAARSKRVELSPMTGKGMVWSSLGKLCFYCCCGGAKTEAPPCGGCKRLLRLYQNPNRNRDVDSGWMHCYWGNGTVHARR